MLFMTIFYGHFFFLHRTEKRSFVDEFNATNQIFTISQNERQGRLSGARDFFSLSFTVCVIVWLHCLPKKVGMNQNMRKYRSKWTLCVEFCLLFGAGACWALPLWGQSHYLHCLGWLSSVPRDSRDAYSFGDSLWLRCTAVSRVTDWNWAIVANHAVIYAN